MILATSARPSPVPDGLVVTKGSKRCGMRSVGTPAPLSSTAISSGRLTRALLPGTESRTPGRNEVDERDLPVCPLLADRLGRVLDEVEEHLDQLVAAPRHRRQRGIVILDDLDLAGEAGACDLLHVIEHVVDVDRLALKRALVAEDLHAVDELADAVRLRRR